MRDGIHRGGLDSEAIGVEHSKYRKGQELSLNPIFYNLTDDLVRVGTSLNKSDLSDLIS